MSPSVCLSKCLPVPPALPLLLKVSATFPHLCGRGDAGPRSRGGCILATTQYKSPPSQPAAEDEPEEEDEEEEDQSLKEEIGSACFPFF